MIAHVKLKLYPVTLTQPLKFNYPQCVCTAVYGVGYSPSLPIIIQSTLRPPEVHIRAIHFNVNARFVWRLWGLMICMPCMWC